MPYPKVFGINPGLSSVFQHTSIVPSTFFTIAQTTPNAIKPQTPAATNGVIPALVVLCASALVIDEVSVGMEVAVAEVI
jgi:hypothetical protein